MAGIGTSTKATDQNIKDGITIGRRLAELGVSVYSGSAPQMDSAFEEGVLSTGRTDLFISWLPWNGFPRGNKRYANGTTHRLLDEFMYTFAYQILWDLGVVWLPKMRQGARKLYCRNVFQILKEDYSKVDLVVFASPPTKSGRVVGGTSIALLLAESLGIPCINLCIPEEREELFQALGLSVTDA